MSANTHETPQRVVITAPDLGVYLGNCFGLGFWSKLETANQFAAVTFAPREEAIKHLRCWKGGIPDIVEFVEVRADEHGYASMQACIDAGLEGWFVPETPTENTLLA